MLIPIFKSHYSLLRSIFTLDLPEDNMDEKKSITLLALCKKNKIQDLFLAETTYAGFRQAYNHCKKTNINLRFGIEFIVCQNIRDKSEESRKTESKITVWALNSEGHYELQNLYSKSHLEGFYYTNRMDWSMLRELNPNNLLITINFYDGFLFQNAMYLNKSIMPNFGEFKPLLFLCDHSLPFDDIIRKRTLEYSKSSSFPTKEVHYCYYNTRRDFYSYMAYRTMEPLHGQFRRTMAKPEFNFLSSEEFSFESYIDKIQK